MTVFNICRIHCRCPVRVLPFVHYFCLFLFSLAWSFAVFKLQGASGPFLFFKVWIGPRENTILWKTTFIFQCFVLDRLEIAGDTEGVKVGQAEAGTEPLTSGAARWPISLEFYLLNHTTTYRVRNLGPHSDSIHQNHQELATWSNWAIGGEGPCSGTWPRTRWSLWRSSRVPLQRQCSASRLLFSLHRGVNLMVVVGAHDISRQESSARKIDVKYYHIHPGYNSKTFQNDIMLLQVRDSGRMHTCQNVS
jgi:hypothetical protein